MSSKCKFCGYIFDEDNLEESIESHIKEVHFLSYQDYYEIQTLGTPFIECWKCGSPRYTISPYLSEVYLPCFNCIDLNKKTNIQEIRLDIFNKIKDFQVQILKSRYYQYLVSLDISERNNLLPKEYKKQSEILSLIKKKDKSYLDKSIIFRVSTSLGRSSEISERNLDALNLDISEFKILKSGDRYLMGDTGLYISLPEVVQFDPKHHSRGSILNPSAKRISRRIKFSDTGECIKFYNTPNPTVKTILNLSNISGSSVYYQDLSEEVRWKIKFGILKTKVMISRIFDVYNEIFKYLSWIEDSVFLLNSFEVPTYKENLGFRLTWSWEEQDWVVKENNFIKISIL